jgi:hypothetical protein
VFSFFDWSYACMYTALLTPHSFESACRHVAEYGGAIMLATPWKAKWLKEIKDHCTPCTTVYVRTPLKDSTSPVTCLLIDPSIDRGKHTIKKWIARCEKRVDYKKLKGCDE